MPSDPLHHGGPAAFETIQQVGTVELDRYCGGCGYNLRQQAIRRETKTQLLLCKCPECGVFEPANTLTTAHRSWFRGLVVIAWLCWLVVWLNLVGWSVFAVVGLALVSGDIRRDWDWVEVEQIDPDQIYANDALQAYRKSSGNHSGSGVSHSYYGDNVMDIRPMRGEDAAIIALFLAVAATLGMLLTTITTVAMPHWRRWGYVCFAVGWPLIGILIFHGLIWHEHYNWRLVTIDLVNWHLACALSIEAIAIVAGLLAVWLGRPVTRGLIRLFVPPRRRGVFAYLWLADGKAPTKTV